jgi:hypothetical protein
VVVTVVVTAGEGRYKAEKILRSVPCVMKGRYENGGDWENATDVAAGH